MKQKDIFTFTTPNEVEVKAVVIMQCGYYKEESCGYRTDTTWLCYAQNRLFTLHELHDCSNEFDEEIGEQYSGKDEVSYEYGETEECGRC